MSGRPNAAAMLWLLWAVERLTHAEHGENRPATCPSTRYRVPQPLPVRLAGACVGHCTYCGRAMATAGDRRRQPELRAYTVRASNRTQCKACRDREIQGRALEPVPRPRPPRRPLSDEAVAALRRQVACLGCGAVPTQRVTRAGRVVVASRHRRGCLVGRIREGSP